MIEKFLSLIKKEEKNDWQKVEYPPTLSIKLLGFMPLRILLLIVLIFLQIIITVNISDNYIHSNIGQIILIIIFFYVIYKTIFYYKRFRGMKQEGINKDIEKALQYLIHSLKLYDEDIFEIGEKKEKRIVRIIKFFYKEDDKKVYIRIAKLGDRFTKIASTLGENLESTLGLELDNTNSTVDYFEYVFLKERDKRIDLSSSINNQQKNSDVIQISGNISYKLSKTPHSLIVGGTGSGKSFFILGKIVSYLSLTPQAELYIIDPKKADLSLLRFIEGMQDRVVTEPNQIAKMLRELVEIMEDRYTTYFNDISAFGKDYTDFGLPPIILIFDEYAAFLSSVDKKLAKEVEDYIFTIVMKGRQAGVTIEILLQRPSADILSTNVRAQMGFKAGLGNMDKIGYNMIFDTNDVDYKTVTEKGGGYIQIDGIHTAPVYFETPYIDKDFDFIQEITKLVKYKK
ncbi:MAG: FtsK/SpoIIIE domain-containing protein [Clostridium sp.]|uniref:FtsK/SpoIIIE domain-containing protein n=1 Tax=Clostridium sp. TaxID=1506 RepID=UPI0029046546|nr:FtsK/SpoIIIE domain-containing protein [Clostridium sp.]MDU1978506.1 FtsK/SpoIIIE domain-containing protein [Clostridium sp.]MDU1994696.1 FtsK/SpoIIIE domain-containing protein [Clostridium sp.]MDU6048355.1 FtsK/SpoIIIE domain-containing protein [Clostridium sp.]MDU6222413.1 FtsK/SpoIIIE domain-containing protein [Clostridium sp.]MDU6273604.1 FtsK/SpoIIIE domain-containing protein [Clostridium sp.]